MKSRSLVSLAVVVVTAGISCAPASGGETAQGSADSSAPSVVGSWRLDSWTIAADTPRCTDEEGDHSGQIAYTADGHMSAQLGCSELSLDGIEALESSEAVALMRRRHFSYYGTYEVDEAAQTVTHHVLGSTAPTWVGTHRVRNFVFEGKDRIVLTPVESESRLVWLRN